MVAFTVWLRIPLMLLRDGTAAEEVTMPALVKTAPPAGPSPLMLSDKLLRMARSASDEGRRDTALLLLAAAHLVLDRPSRRLRRPLIGRA
jgi:hypothetical protein